MSAPYTINSIKLKQVCKNPTPKFKVSLKNTLMFTKRLSTNKEAMTKKLTKLMRPMALMRFFTQFDFLRSGNRRLKVPIKVWNALLLNHMANRKPKLNSPGL